MHPISRQLTEWYRLHARDLPWRNTKDPYLVWLSEVILQQTRVNQGLSYYYAFAGAYPTVKDLAAADPGEVMRLWQGLGYYSRARNMMHTAKEVVEKYGGTFPSSYTTLIKLKGIGDYTASAIASFCGNEAVPVLDGNVFRFLSRLFGIQDDIAKTTSRAVFKEVAMEILPTKSPGMHNQAIMEFGALQCKPGIPDCGSCVFFPECFAAKNHRQGALPVKSAKAKPENRYFLYLVVMNGQSVLTRLRSGKDIWQELHEFYLIESAEDFHTNEIPLDLIKEKLPEMKLKPLAYSPSYKHQLTHRTIHARFAVIDTGKGKTKAPATWEWTPIASLHEKAFPRLITKFMESDLFRNIETS